MENIWAGLFVLGFMMPGLVLVGSTIILLRLARRRQRLAPPGRPLWQYLALHLALGFGLAIPLGPVGAAAWLALPGYLFWTLRRPEAPTTSRQPVGYPLAGMTAGRRSWGVAVIFALTGLLLPWATGLGVKMYLDSIGRPTLPIEGFIDPASVAILLVLTLGAWAFPFLVLASALVVPWRVGFEADSPDRGSPLPIWTAYAAGVIAAVPVFVGVFWEFDTMMLLAPVGLVLLPPMALGYFVGWWLLRRRGMRPRPA